MITAIYARKSPSAIALSEDAKSVKRQVDNGRAYAERKGWSVNEAWVLKNDDDISGAEFENRDDLVRLLNMLEQCRKRHTPPPFQVLVVMDIDRLGREQFELGYVIKQISLAGVRIFTYPDDKELKLETPVEQFLMQAQGFAATLERHKTRQRVQDAMVHRARAGYVTGCLVFGYDNRRIADDEGKKAPVMRVKNDAQAAIVRRIFAMSACGMGYSRIAHELNREGAPAPKPKRGRLAGWSHSTVRVVLHRRLYVGEGFYNRTEKRDSVWGQKKLRRRPESEWIPVAAPPIITEAEWRAAHDRLDGVRERLQAIGAAVGNRRARDVDSDYLLSGFARCATCGGSLGVLSGGRARRRVYGCARALKTGLCANRVRVPIERADDAVLHTIVDQVLTETVTEVIVERVMTKLAPTTVSRTVDELRTALQSVEREIGNVTRAIAVGGELDSLLEKLRECEKRRNDLRVAIDGRERIQGRRIDRTVLETAVRHRVDEWRGLLDRRPAHGRQLLREMLAGPITFTPERGVYRFRGEASFGALAGEASGTPCVVPVRGFEPRFDG